MPMTDEQLYERYSQMIEWCANGKDGLESVDLVFDNLKLIARDSGLKYLKFNQKTISIDKFLALELSKTPRFRFGTMLSGGRSREHEDVFLSHQSCESYNRVGSGDFNSSLKACYLDQYDKLIKEYLLPIINSGRLIFSWQLQCSLKFINQAFSAVKELDMKEEQYFYFEDDAGFRTIDHFNSPFRNFRRREGYTEAIGSEMWCGPSFWMMTDANLDELRAIKGITLSTFSDSIVHIKTDRPFKIGDEQVKLANELRRILFPNTWNLDQARNVRS